MVKSEIIISRVMLLLLLSVFPLGMLASYHLKILDVTFPIYLIDLLSGLIALWYVLKGSKEEFKTNYLFFITTCIFSLILALGQLHIFQVLHGSLYLLRFSAYFLLIFAIVDIRKNTQTNLLINSLILIIAALTIFGWIGLAILPNYRAFTILGFDDHLYRLSGTLFDPNFMGLVIVIGIIITYSRYWNRGWGKLLVGFFVISLLATFSRSSYLSLIAGLFVLIKNKNKIPLIFVSLGIVGLIYLVFNNVGGEGFRLLRMKSITNRIEYSLKAWPVLQDNPIFGIGYNTLCYYKTPSVKQGSYINNNSCFGVDSSLYLVLLTTGVFGFFIFIQTFKIIIEDFGLWEDKMFRGVLVSVLTHSLFVNSLFFPWIMLILSVLMGDLAKFSKKS